LNKKDYLRYATLLHQKRGKLWISGEVQADVVESFMTASHAIEGEVNQLIQGISLGENAEEWAFIVIRKQEHPDYGEIIKKSSRGKSLEFCLKISHAAFASGGSRRAIRLMLQS
jgi:hypothetical protein